MNSYEENIQYNKSIKKLNFKGILSIPEIGVLIPLAVLFIITSIGNEAFLTKTNIIAILVNLAFIGVIALGESLVIMTGEIDISVGQVSAFTAMIGTTLMVRYHFNPIIAIVFAILFAVLIGLINGTLVSRVGLSAFITTIGMYFIARGMKFFITKGYPVYPLPESVAKFGGATPLGISWGFFIALILLVIFEFILRKTIFGRNVYAVGDNKEVAELSGINVKMIKTIAYVLSSAMACIAGLLLCFQIGVGQPSMGDGWELQAIAASAVGGISLAGGAGSMIGTALGVTFIAILNNSLVMFGVDTNIQTVLTGVVLIVAVTFDIIKRKRKISS